MAEPALEPHKRDFVVSVFFKHASGQQTGGTTLDRAHHVTGLSASMSHDKAVWGGGAFLLRAFWAAQLGAVRGLLALSIHSVHCHGRLQVVAVMEAWVVWAVVMEPVAQQGGSLRWGVQVQVVIMVAYVHPGR